MPPALALTARWYRLRLMVRKLSRLLLVARCWLRAGLYGAATTPPKTISTIIVEPAGKLGDVVCVTPVFAALRAHLPGARIIAAGNAKLHRPLLADSGLVDDFLDLAEPGAGARIAQYRADVAILTGHSFEHAAQFYLAGIPLVVGPRAVGIDSPEETRPYEMLLPLMRSFPHQFKGYAPRERLRALEPIGIKTADTRKRLGFSKRAEEEAAKIIAAIPAPYRYLVGIAVGAGNKEKCWPAEKFAAVANHLVRAHGAHIVLLGGNNDREQSDAFLAAFIDRTKVTDTVDASLDELKALIARLDLFVSVNTGPLYIAEAFDIPTVDLLGPVNPWDQPPQGTIHKMVFAPGKPKPLLYILDSRRHNVKEATRIAQSTRVEDVISAVEEALTEINRRKGAT